MSFLSIKWRQDNSIMILSTVFWFLHDYETVEIFSFFITHYYCCHCTLHANMQTAESNSRSTAIFIYFWGCIFLAQYSVHMNIIFKCELFFFSGLWNSTMNSSPIQRRSAVRFEASCYAKSKAWFKNESCRKKGHC